MDTSGVVVKASPIQGVGIFATRDFRAGEIILVRDESREVTPEHPLRPELGEFERHCDWLAGGRVVLLGYPERHLNHCCDPSAYVRFTDGRDAICARRDIAAGEEITNDYCINGFGDGVWPCACGHARCRKLVRENFFAEPPAVRLEYLPLLADWFVAEHPREVEALHREAAWRAR
ncbi:MAG: SET domain-containing protein [Dehalococcoidia bacterium]